MTLFCISVMKQSETTCENACILHSFLIYTIFEIFTEYLKEFQNLLVFGKSHFCFNDSLHLSWHGRSVV